MFGAGGARRSRRTSLPEGTKDQEGRAPDWRSALFGECPVCGARSLFTGPAQFAPACNKCGADFSQANVGDGPAAFLTLIIGALVVALAMLLEVYVTPPFWVHVLIWVPFTFAAVLFGLRGAKAWLFHAEWHRRAAEGRLVVEGDDDE
jgi:uncharacterized protein (DUF983 family)